MMMTYVISTTLFKPVLYTTYYRMMRVFDLTVSPQQLSDPPRPGPCNCRQLLASYRPPT